MGAIQEFIRDYVRIFTRVILGLCRGYIGMHISGYIGITYGFYRDCIKAVETIRGVTWRIMWGYYPNHGESNGTENAK